MLRGVLPGALLLAGALAKDDWRLTHTDKALTKESALGKYCEGHNIRVGLIGGALCDGVESNISVNTPTCYARTQQCVFKCAPGGPCDGKTTGECASCNGFIKAYDEDETSDALCLTETECWDLCARLPECYGIEAATDQANHKRCYLNTYACNGDRLTDALVEDSNYDSTFKSLAYDDSCPLGTGFRVYATKDAPEDADVYDVAGIYDRLPLVAGRTLGPVYQRVDGTDRIVLHDSTCGWVVEKAELPMLRRLSGTTDCVDDVSAVHAAFGLGAESKEENLCASAAFARQYCSHPLFAALCPFTCDVATCGRADAEAAAPELLQLLGREGSTCAEATDFCNSAVVASVCKATCAGRSGRSAVPKTFAADFLSQLRRADQPTERRLGWDMDKKFYTVYYAFEEPPALPPTAQADCGKDYTEVTIPTDGTKLYDVFLLHQATKQTWEHTCAHNDGWRTAHDLYCPHNNMLTYGSSAPSGLSSARCVTKCGSSGELPGTPAGTGYCAGWSDDMATTSNALCLPRSACEDLCDATEGCSSIDMHPTLPRCYLNGPYCAPGVNPYTGPPIDMYSFNAGIYEHTANLDFLYRMKDRDTYKTHDGMACTGDDEPIHVGSEKESCSEKCQATRFGSEVVLHAAGLGWTDDKKGMEHASNYFGIDFSQDTDFKTATSSVAFLPPNQVVVVEYGHVAVGVVDYDMHEVYFGDPVAPPWPEEYMHEWGDMIVTAVEDPTSTPKFAVYATLPGRGVITAVGSADIRSNVVWETVDVPSWEGELYHHLPNSEKKKYFSLTGGSATAAGKWGVLAGVTEDGPAVLWYDVTDNKGAYLQLDPTMSPLSTFGQAPDAIDRRLDARPAPKPSFDPEDLSQWKDELDKYTPAAEKYVVRSVQTSTSVAVAVLDFSVATEETLTVYIFDEAKTHGVTAVVKSVTATEVGKCAIASEGGFGIAHLVGETVVLVCGDDQAVCDTATDTCAESVHTGSGLMHVDCSAAGPRKGGPESGPVVAPAAACVGFGTGGMAILQVDETGVTSLESFTIGLDQTKVDSTSFAVLGRGHAFLAATPKEAAGTAQRGVLAWEEGGMWAKPKEGICKYWHDGTWTGKEICGQRAECEAVCTRLGKDCGAIEMFGEWDNMMCKLYPKCEAAADADFTVVEKTAQADCTVEVKGANVDVKEKGDCTYDEEDADPFTCELNQVYYQVARDEFRTKFNESRIKYHPEQTCTGWVLSQNRKATRLIMKYTLLDADEDVLNEYRTFWREILNPGVANNVPLPGCEQLGTDEVMDGKPDSWSCDDDVVLRKLCAASCLDTTTEVIADKEVTFHEELIDGLSADWESDAGAEVVANTANCAAIGGCDCAAACTCTDPEDECTDDGTGVSHGDQRLVLLLWLCPKSCQRSPSRPKPHLIETLNYLPGEVRGHEQDSDFFAPLFQSFANGSHMAYTEPQTEDGLVKAYGYSQCTDKGRGITADVSQLTTDMVYRSYAPQSEHIKVKSVCAKEALCPTLTTCVQTDDVFTSEMKKLRGTEDFDLTDLFRSQTRLLDRLHSQSWLDAAVWKTTWTTASEDYEVTFPKILLSADRAEALIRTSLWQYGKEIFRPVPGHTRVRVSQFPKGTETIVLSLAESSDHMSIQNFGRTYPAAAGYTEWMSDVVRIEAFTYDYVDPEDEAWRSTPEWEDILAKDPTADKVALQIPQQIKSGTFAFEIFVPGAYDSVGVFRYSSVSAKSAGKHVAAIGGSVTPKAGGQNPGWYVVTVPAEYANADFVAAADLDECAGKNLCETEEDGGKCVNSPGGYYCECLPGYVGENGEEPGERVEPGVQCLVKEYTAPDQEFLLYHNDAVGYGWTASEIRLFEYGVDGKCRGSPYSSMYIQNLKVSSEYPKNEGSKLTDNTAAEWRAEGLELDRLKGTGGWIAFTVAPDVTVGCVRLEMKCGPSQPTSFTLHRGKTGVTRSLEAYSSYGVAFTPPGIPGWIESATEHRDKDQDKVDFAISCGIQNAQYFGEQFADYMDVTSPCECKQLCVDHVDEGCSTWKWYGETMHCFLQKDMFSGLDADSEVLPKGALATDRASLRSRYTKGSGWWKRPFAEGWPGWVTGTTGPVVRKMTVESDGDEVKAPFEVDVGADFSISLHGVGFPFDESVSEDLGARQRIKLVPAGETCILAAVPEEVEGVDCTNEYTCTPKPSSYTRTKATWSGLSITARKAKAEYQVCWCVGSCWEVASWHEVPGSTISVTAAPFSWAFETQDFELTRATGTGVKIRVSRPSFTGTSDKAAWKLKLVKDTFDCDALGDEKVCGGAVDCGVAGTEGTKFGPDEAVWTINFDRDAATGNYHVCLDDDGDGSWDTVPSADSRYLVVTGTPDDSSHPRGPFHFQRFSGKASDTETATVTVKGFRMASVNQASVALVSGDDCFYQGGAQADGTFMTILGRSEDDTSDADSYVFSGTIPTAVGSGKYTVCMCEPGGYDANQKELRSDVDANWQSDGAYDDAAAYGANFYYYDAPGGAENAWGDGAQGPTTVYTVFRSKGMSKEFETIDLSATKYKDDTCAKKCSGGCVGPTCFCDGKEDADKEADEADGGPLCLDMAGCRAACDALGTFGCAFYSMHVSKNRCYLASEIPGGYPDATGPGVTGLPTNYDYDLWKKKAAGANDPCTTIGEFMTRKPRGDAKTKTWMKKLEAKKNLGAIYVTTKADLSVDYITTPGEVTSLEITGSGLDYQKDRVMIIDCYGTCGVTKPTAVATAPGVAVNALIDRPSQMPDPGLTAKWPGDFQAGTNVSASYCPGNMPVKPGSLHSKHLCYSKCYDDQPCTDADSCFCNGFISGHDTPESRAVCLDLTQCERLCELTPGCHSVDMSRNQDRCFLNTWTCDTYIQEDTTVPDYDYDIFVRPVDDNQRRLIEKGRRLQPEQARQLRAAVDPGHSWGNILRFADISFAEGGEFKLCFCDSSLLGTNEICDSAEDFTIEVGKVHATGLQCLLSDPKMTRATCESQLYGGLRCYDGDAPTVTIPSQFHSVPHPSDPKGGSVDGTHSVPGCYGTNGENRQHGVCDCTITQAECATLVDSGEAISWYSKCTMDMCGTHGGYTPKRANEWSDMTTMLASYCQYSTAEEAAQFPICDQWRDDAYDIEMDAGRPKSPYDLESRGGASP